MLSKSIRIMPVFLGLLVTPLLLVTSVSAQVNDGARIFSADAVTQANGIISKLRQGRQKDFLIETFASIPQDAGGGSEKGSKTFFHDWAISQSQRNHVNGIYTLVSMDPRHVETSVGNKTEADGFSVADRDKLTQIFVQNFKSQQYDEGLLAAVKFATERLEATSPHGAGSYSAQPNPGGGSNAPYGRSLPSSGGARGFGFGGLICVGVVILVVIMLVRAFSRSRGGGYGQGGYPSGPMQGGGNYGPGYGPQYGAGGGGGFGKGLLGGLLGGAIGSWGYDRLTHGGGNPASGGDAFPGGGGSTGGSDVDTSYSSGGSDFGSSDSGGGADFGSSDSGGGGGGDSGSSGGDF